MTQQLKIIVTGGAGFIGSHLVDALVSSGHSVTVIDDFSAGAKLNINERSRLLRADIRDSDKIASAFDGVDIVFHHAAIASVPQCSAKPLNGMDINVQGTMAIAEILRCLAPAARLIFASSAAVYGASASPTRFAEESPASPASIYGASKYMAERGLLSYSHAYGLDVRIVRYANVYGPRQPRYILFDMYNKVRDADKYLEILGSGKQLRDFIYVRDAVTATIAVAMQEVAAGLIFNIGTGKATSVVALAQEVSKQMGKPDLELRTTNSSWLGDVDYLLLDPSRVQKISCAEVPLSTGVKEFIAWMEAAPKSRTLQSA